MLTRRPLVQGKLPKGATGLDDTKPFCFIVLYFSAVIVPDQSLRKTYAYKLGVSRKNAPVYPFTNNAGFGGMAPFRMINGFAGALYAGSACDLFMVCFLFQPLG